MSTSNDTDEASPSIHYDYRKLLIPAIICLWIIPFITFSPPDDWRVSRFGTAPILPPFVLKAIKFFGRGTALGIMCFCLMGVWNHPKRSYALGIMMPFMLFGLLSMASTLWSPITIISLQQSATFFLLLMIACYIGTVWKSDRDTERLVKHAGLAIFCLSVVLIGLHFGMPSSGALTKESSGILHSTNAGASAGLGILLTLFAKILWRSPWSAWWFPVIGTELILMLIGGNRLSLIVTLICVLIFLAIALHRGIAAVLVLAVTIIVGGYFVADPQLKLLDQASKGVGVYASQGQTKNQIKNLSGRAEMWDKMWKSYLNAPIAGHGFFATTAKGRIYVWGEWGNWTAHNLILQTLTTMGLVGLLLLIMGFIFVANGAYSGYLMMEGVNRTLIMVLVTSVWFFGWGFLNSSFMGPLQPESMVFAMTLGATVGLGSTAHYRAHTNMSGELMDGSPNG